MRAWMSVLCAVWLAGTIAAGAQTRPSAPVAPAETRPSTPVAGGPALQGFSVVLVLGDIQGSGTSGDVPAAASRALADMKDFLPYKSYRLLDTAWMLGSSPKSRLRGPDNQDYEVSISTMAVQPAVSVRFHLQETGGPEVSGSVDQVRRFDELSARRRELERNLAEMEREAERIDNRLGKQHPTNIQAQQKLREIRAQMAELESQSRALSGSTKIIETTFQMQIGETVVVGTSRVQGNSALIALLTAVPRAGK